MNFNIETAAVVLLSFAGGILTIYGRYRTMNIALRSAENRLKNKENKSDKQEGIDKEAEWKRILDERASMETKLRERDDEQERRLDNLLTRFIEAEKDKAAKGERIKILEERIERMTILLAQRCPDCPMLRSVPEIIQLGASDGGQQVRKSS